MSFNVEAITNKSVDEMIELMKTEEFSKTIDDDATFAIFVKYSKILLENYHSELAKTLRSKGVEI